MSDINSDSLTENSGLPLESESFIAASSSFVHFAADDCSREQPGGNSGDSPAESELNSCSPAGDDFCYEQPNSPLDAVTFDEGPFEFQGVLDGYKVWHSESGDGVGLFYFGIPPDVPFCARSVDDYREMYRSAVGQFASVVSVDLPVIDDCQIVEAIVKVPQQPHGMTYTGSFTIPFRDFSFVLKVQCIEYGTTGLRESLLLSQAFDSGNVDMKDGVLRMDYVSDDEEFDSRFPDHPLSRLRGIMRRIRGSIRMRADVKKLAPFHLLTSGTAIRHGKRKPWWRFW